MRISVSLLMFASWLAASGCSLCPPGYLEDYATVGGKWTRTDPSTGRVGSILSDPGTSVSGEGFPQGGQSEFYEPLLGDPIPNDFHAAPPDPGAELDVLYEPTYPGGGYGDRYYESVPGRVPPVAPLPEDDGVIILGDDW